MLLRWTISLTSLALPLFFSQGHTVNPSVWMKNYNEFPLCGSKCAMGIIPSSNCKTFTNYTCLCEDLAIKAVMADCVYEKCTGMETLRLAKLNAEGCEVPVRSRRAVLLALIPIEIVVVTSFVLRFTSRKMTVGRYDQDDFIMFLVSLLYFFFIAITNLAYFQGFGVDIWTLDEHKVEDALRLFYISNTLYLIIMELTKISVLLFYLRVFPHDNFRMTTFITITWVASCTFIFMALQIFQCLPITFNWLGWRGDFGDHRCIDINRFAYGAGATMIAQDVFILLLPLPWLISLNTNIKNKIGIIIMFNMGLFILITSCIRMRYLVTYARTLNPTWDYTDQLVWSDLEVAVSILVVNIPAIRVLFVKKISPAIHSALNASRYYKTGSEYYKDCSTLASGTRSSMPPPKDNNCRTNSSSSKSSKGGPPVGMTIDENAPLELGDKLKGDVQTVICVGMPAGGFQMEEFRRLSAASSPRPRGQSAASEMSLESGILVETTTTRVVDVFDTSNPLGERSASDSASSSRRSRGFSLSWPRRKSEQMAGKFDV